MDSLYLYNFMVDCIMNYVNIDDNEIVLAHILVS